MDPKRSQWNTRHNLLKTILPKPDRFEEAIGLCLQQHAMVHASEMSNIKEITFEDELWEGLREAAFRIMPTPQAKTIAWGIWHVTRIEDITMNILVAGEAQVINSSHWMEKLKVAVCDTGNAMTDGEIIDLSSKLDMAELRNYRMAVGRRTREIIQSFQPADVKRKMEPKRLKRIVMKITRANHRD